MNPPFLTIAVESTRNLGRCYNETVYKVMSKSPLSDKMIRSIRSANLIGYGQEFSFYELLPDGSKLMVQENVSYDRRQPEYTYICTDRVDSSD